VSVASARQRSGLRDRNYGFDASVARNERGYVARAIRSAEASLHRTRVGATLVVAGRVTSASNRLRNSHVAPYTEQSVHAEIRAVLRAYNNGRGGTIYVARLGAKGKLLASHPCARCTPVLREAGVRRVVWWTGETWVAEKL
jgi:tRNA(Arg) A34 adenosine deaminase TadA